MYRSLLRFFPVGKLDTLDLLYSLYIGNLDSRQCKNVPLTMVERTMDSLCSLAVPFARLYHTEVQLYRSMNGLLRNIRYKATIQDTRDAVKQFRPRASRRWSASR